MLLGLLLAFAATFAGFYVGSRARSPAAPPRWNLVLVSVDALRADRMSAYGYARETSPFLEALLPESIRFDRFYYQGGGTLPSHLTLLTSLHPHTHAIGPHAPQRLPEEHTTLAEHLQAQGYRTAAWVGGGWLSARFGFDQGFEQFEEDRRGFEEILPEVARWLQAPDSRPFFLFLHSYDVHSSPMGLPYDCPGDGELRFAGPPPPGFAPCQDGLCAASLLAEWNARARARQGTVQDEISPETIRYLSDLYDGCVAYADSALERLVALLEQHGFWRRTVLAIVADHGEEFGEHGLLLHDQGGYEELARVPWILRLPDRRFAGRAVSHLAAMSDVAPTLLDLINVPPLPDAQGKSHLPALERGTPVRAEVHMYSVLRTERFKYFSDEKRLFDLEKDPAELDNLYSARPELVSQLEARVRRLIAADEAWRGRLRMPGAAAGPADLDPELIEKLRSLGYLR